MSQERLFVEDAAAEATGTAPEVATRPNQARVNGPVRNQLEMVMRDLDSTLAEDHPARTIWAFLERLDLSAFYTSIQAVEGVPGRPATDPKVLLALWVYATAEGIGSARQLERLCEEHDAFRWLRGAVPINYHMLSDFRVEHGRGLDDLLSQILAAMMSQELVTLKRVSQDGIRVRADAGASSFRRQKTLEELLLQAKEQVERLAQEREHPERQVSRREQAAQERAARQRQQRVEKALEQLPLVRAAKKTEKDKENARVSTTDPQARVMKMADGGFRPAYNIQVATDTEADVVVGVEAINQGTDSDAAAPMLEKVIERCGKVPEGYLIDGGYATLDNVDRIAAAGPTLYAPVRAPRGKEREATQPRPGDSPAVAQWRERMGTEQAKSIYKERAASSEWVNAQLRERHGLRQFGVRGLPKVLIVMLLMAVTHDLLRWIALTS